MLKIAIHAAAAVMLLLGACAPADLDDEQTDTAALQAPPLGGWHILSPTYDAGNPLDIISYEWDYYMIHDQARGFYGIIGYLVSNPRDRLGNLQILPNGASVAAVGQIRGAEPFSQYLNFGAHGYTASADERYLDAVDSKGHRALLEPLPHGGPSGEDAMHLKGRTDQLAWDLVVIQDWANRPSGGPRGVTGTDAGVLPQEVWTVDVIWPRTHVKGSIANLQTGELFAIDAHGYRENAWGRYNTVFDGWDFMVGSESEADLLARQIPPAQGVGFHVQTYHKSSPLDYAEVTFYDGGVPRTVRFVADLGELHWKHTHWKWDSAPWSCTPHDMSVSLENPDYRISISFTYGHQDQHPLLSNATLAVSRFFIQDTFPTFIGTIVRTSNQQVVRSFSGKGVGEFSLAKSLRLWPASDLECTLWGRLRFAR